MIEELLDGGPDHSAWKPLARVSPELVLRGVGDDARATVGVVLRRPRVATLAEPRSLLHRARSRRRRSIRCRTRRAWACCRTIHGRRQRRRPFALYAGNHTEWAP